MKPPRTLITEMPLNAALLALWRRISVVLLVAITLAVGFATFLLFRGDILQKRYFLELIVLLAAYSLVRLLQRFADTLILFVIVWRKEKRLLPTLRNVPLIWNLIGGMSFLTDLFRVAVRRRDD